MVIANSRSKALTIVAWVGLSALFAYVLIRYGFAAALFLTMLIPFGVALAQRPGYAVLFGVGVVLVVPASSYLGLATATPLRVGALVALISLLSTRRSRLRSSDVGVIGIVTLAALLWAMNQGLGVSLSTMTIVLLPFTFYLCVRVNGAADMLRPALWVLFACGIVGALTVVAEATVGHSIFFDPLAYQYRALTGQVFRPEGIYASPPGAAIALGMIVLSTAGLFREKRWTVGLGASLMLIAIILTFGRAGWLGLVFGSATFYLLVSWQTGASRRLVLIVIGAGIVSLAGALFVLPDFKTNEKVQSALVRSEASAQREDIFTLTRSLIADDGQHILAGRGPGMILGVNNGDPVRLDTGIVSTPLILERGGPHSTYLLVLIEQGIFGLFFVMLWLVGSVTIGAVAARRFTGQDRALLAGLAGAVTCYIIASLWHDTAHASQNLALAAFVSGLLVVTCTAVNRSEDSEVGEDALGGTPGQEVQNPVEVLEA